MRALGEMPQSDDGGNGTNAQNAHRPEELGETPNMRALGGDAPEHSGYCDARPRWPSGR